jgi:hypothetical protein
MLNWWCWRGPGIKMPLASLLSVTNKWPDGEMTHKPQLGQGLDSLVKEIEEKMSVKRCGAKEMREEESYDQTQQEIIALVFGEKA